MTKPTFTPAELAALRAKVASWPPGSPYTNELRERLKRLGGQHRATSPADERRTQAEDLAVETARMKREPAVSPW